MADPFRAELASASLRRWLIRLVLACEEASGEGTVRYDADPFLDAEREKLAFNLSVDYVVTWLDAYEGL